LSWLLLEDGIPLPYGDICFASIVYELVSNYFLAITRGNESPRPPGEILLWEVSKYIVFERV